MREKSGFLSSLGTLFQILKVVLDDVLAAGGNDYDFRRLQTDQQLREQVVELIVSARKSVQAQLRAWEKFYRKYFDLKVDFASVQIPPKPEGFDRLIVVAKGLTLNQVYDVCAKQFPSWRYVADLDKAIPNNDRKPDQTYVIWVRDRVEADEELKNLSADQLKEQGIIGITLLERMLYELKYWDEIKQHLDIQNWTLCSGSRDSGGPVPRVYYGPDDRKVHVYCSHPDVAGDGFRSRSVVSFAG